MIVIDSWNNRSWSPEVFPNIWNFSSRCTYYRNHLSSSNGTTGSTFGMFFGLPSYFRNDIEATGTQPLLVEQMLASGYDVKAFSSATLVYPPFARLLFANVPDLRIESKGKTVYERDCEITNEFISYIENSDGKRPFYSLLFYDLAHGYELPAEKLTRFTPSWEFANYLALNNNTDPTPFWNLYRNCLFQIDSLVGRVINSLEEKKLLDNTVVVITGDHGQEFNENRKNFWGHNSNYSPVQLRVPLLYFDASQAAAIRHHRTTHYDIAPTLLKSVLGVQNDVSDLGAGHLLEDSCSRDWHIVGDNINYAFIREEDNTIIEKKHSGYIDVYDSLMNLRNDYKINARELNEVILELNKFYK
jgi:membrane-anchored protein YejM (alkaline phosphatase superfamily)